MTKAQARERITKLKKLINYHRYLYHILDRQEISAEALDSLKKELFDLEQKFPDLVSPDSPTQRVGGEPQEKFEKAQHPTPMLSINDAFSQKDVEDWIERIKKLLTEKEIAEIDFYCELKLDGVAMELIYRKGILAIGSTRGNGIIGENVTENLKTIEAIPLKLRNVHDIIKDFKNQSFDMAILQSVKTKFRNTDLIIRGEILIAKKNFKNINRLRQLSGLFVYANPRNLAAGSIRQLDPKITAARELDSYAYDLITDFGENTHEQKHKILKILGFKVNPYNQYCRDLNQVSKYFQKIQNMRANFPYEIDGVVININSNRIFTKLGTIGKAPRGVIALKFPLKQTTTIIKDIKIQVGRTGALTPIALLKPVKIGGVIVSRATLHNEDEIKRLGVRIGDTVIVGRAGDVIPDIVKVLPEMRTGKEKIHQMPKICPSCGQKIIRTRKEVVWRCVNSDCFAKRQRHFVHFVSRAAFDIAGLGPKITNQLMEQALISDPADIFVLQEGDLVSLTRFADKSAGNLVKAINASKKISLSRFIYAIGIRGVGEETSYDLADIFGNIQSLKQAGIEDLENIRDIGPVVAKSIYHWFRDKKNLEFLEKLEKAGVKIISPAPVNASESKQKLDGKTFVLTGTLKSMTRDQAKQKIRAFGGEISESASRQTDYVVVGENPGSKFQKAKTIGIKIITEKEFLQMLR